MATNGQGWVVRRSDGVGLTRGRVVAAVGMGVVAAAFLAVGIVLCLLPAGSLPGWLGHESVVVGGQRVPSPGYHPLRAVGSLIGGAVFAGGAVFSLRYRGTRQAEAETGAELTSAR